MDIFDLSSERCKHLACIVWLYPFFSGLRKFNKSELIYLICELVRKFNEKTLPNYCELDIKDASFSDKCVIIETLQEDFFTKR